MAPSGLGTPIVGVKWGGEPKLVGPEGPSGVQTLLLGHFLVIWVRGKGSKWVRTPYSWGKMEWGAKIGGSRGPKWRLDPLWGPLLAILSHFGPF